MKLNQTIIKAAADHSNLLNQFDVTTDANGYPSLNGNVAIVDFNTWDDCQVFSSEHDVPIHLFKIKDGHHYVIDMGVKWNPLTAVDYVNDMGDNAQIETDFDFDVFKERLNDLPNDFDIIETFVNVQKELFEQINYAANNDKIVISDHGVYFETVDKEMMCYHEDVTTYYIGVLLEKQTFDFVFMDENQNIEDSHYINESFEHCEKLLNDKTTLLSLIKEDFNLSDDVTHVGIQNAENGEIYHLQEMPK